MKKNKIINSFVDFYSLNKISPVSQDIQNFKKHIKRRNSLYLSLGIIPSFVKNKTFLEFGPGSGHNSIHTALLKPKKYILIEGNELGFRETKKRLSQKKFFFAKVIKKLFLDFRSNIKYDIVWAEGCIPHQKNPVPIISHIKKFVVNDGLLVISTASGVSYLSEVIRRLIAERILSMKNISINDQVKLLEPIFNFHLSFLKNKSRPVKDWILDSIIHPLQDSKLFSIPEAIKCLEHEFNAYNTSPKFITNWRWYKSQSESDNENNNNFLSEYYKKNINLLDNRFEYPIHPESFGLQLEALCNSAWDIMCKIQKHKKEKDWLEMYSCILEIIKFVKIKSPETALSLKSAYEALKSQGRKNTNSKPLASWWGRGQQYISFIKNK